ncbi:PREDICTED: glycosylation-dependent cell adhesion molecule 1-like [Chinchilla lanigera]|uniref:glycosylation-dependent cell adhesion molecule 1-like n=1 Tax=Chinchilla lanigera TaxID=34839 RepID=UPI00038EDE9B|nr:PREDICTED: glycosylation-dependent cell adhesion molecule 1-like [Chinchilla lanigera]
MEVFALLLLASLASTSLSILHEPEDKILVKTQHTVATTQFVPPQQPRKDHASNEDLSKESFISREKMIAEENVEIKPIGQNSQDSVHPRPILQEESFGNAILQSEETTELTPRAATTSERKMAKLSHKIEKNLDKIQKNLDEIMTLTTIHGQFEKLNP